MATCVQRTTETCRGIRLVTPTLIPRDLKVMTLSNLRDIIKLERDEASDLIRLHLHGAFNELTRAIDLAEGAR